MSTQRKKSNGKKKNKAIIFAIEIIVLVVMLVVLGLLIWSDKIGQAPDFDEFDIPINPSIKGVEVAVTELTGTEKIVENVVLEDGTVLVKAGTILDSKTLKLLKDNGIEKVYVENKSSVVISDEYWNVALFGVDSRTGALEKSTLSDVMIVASINKTTKEVKLVSVYRDTYLNVSDGRYTKANTAYSIGGASKTMGMLNVNLDLNITDFATVGFEGVMKVVDALGGVEVEISKVELAHINSYQSTMAEELGLDGYEKVTETGFQKLNGLQTTAYCRIRYMAGGDYARTANQREVIYAIMEKAQAADLKTLTKIATDLMPYVYTSFNLEDIIGLLTDINKYEIIGDEGFPHEKTAGPIGPKGDCVVPVPSLEQNVIWLHEYLFDETEYKPSSEVKEYSQKIYDDTQSYLGY